MVHADLGVTLPSKKWQDVTFKEFAPARCSVERFDLRAPLLGRPPAAAEAVNTRSSCAADVVEMVVLVGIVFCETALVVGVMPARVVLMAIVVAALGMIVTIVVVNVAASPAVLLDILGNIVDVLELVTVDNDVALETKMAVPVR